MFRMGKTPKPEADSENLRDAAPTPSYTPTYNNPMRQDSVPPPPPSRPSMPTMSSSMSRPDTAPNRAFSESEAVARDIKEGNLSGFVGNGTALTGEVTFKAMLRIDGHLTGRISSDSGTLIVGTSGQVDANIEVAFAVIHGSVNGDIIASQRLEMGRAARVFGNIQAPKLVIEEGAVYEGNCRMVQAKEALEKKNAPPPVVEVKPEPIKVKETPVIAPPPAKPAAPSVTAPANNAPTL